MGINETMLIIFTNVRWETYMILSAIFMRFESLVLTAYLHKKYKLLFVNPPVVKDKMWFQMDMASEEIY